MAKRISAENILLIKSLRSKGWSLPEIYQETKIGYGSIFRYVHDIYISPKHKDTWYGKRGGSIKRKEKLLLEANKKAKRDILELTEKERLLFLVALYWGEGGKIDFNFTNSDPKMIKIFVSGLISTLRVKKEDIKASIRIYEDIDKRMALDYWSRITNIPVNEFISVNILKGKKTGKLKYGLCRIRIKKGGNMLKYLLALNNRVSELY